MNPNGRPKKQFTLLIEEIKALGGEVVTKAMVDEAYMLLFSLNDDQLLVVAKDKSKPVVIQKVAEAMMGPFGIAQIERMLDRSHGKPVQSVKQELSGELTIDDHKMKQLRELKERLGK